MATNTPNYDLIKPAYADAADIADINENMDIIDDAMNDNAEAITTVDGHVSTLQGGLAIVSDNNTHAAITSGQYVYVRGHSTLAEGLYVASSNIAANAALTSSNLTAAPGALNGLAGDISTLNGKLTTKIGNFLEIGSSYTSSISATTLRCTRRDDGLCVVDGTFTVSTAISSTARTAMFTGLPEVKNNISWATATNLTDGKTYRLSIGTTTLDEFYTAYPTGEYVVSPFMYYS